VEKPSFGPSLAHRNDSGIPLAVFMVLLRTLWLVLWSVSPLNYRYRGSFSPDARSASNLLPERLSSGVTFKHAASVKVKNKSEVLMRRSASLRSCERRRSTTGFSFGDGKIQSESVAESYWSLPSHPPAGVDMRTLQEWMGHNGLASTMLYLKPNRSQAVHDRVEGTFG
jgi:hypothetical protein